MNAHLCRAAAAAIMFPAFVHGQSSLVALPPGPGRTTSQSLCVSADGSVIGGQCSGGFLSEATLWAGSGAAVTVVGDVLSPPLNSVAGVSNLGQVAGGSISRIVSGPNGPYSVGNAARWTPLTGWELLDPAFAVDSSLARSVSADGGTLVGYGRNTPSGSPYTAFRWTAAGGWQALQAFSESFPSRLALGVSGDGSVVCGTAQTPDASEEAVLWRGGELVRLGFAGPSGVRTSSALAITADGLIAAGASTGLSGRTEAVVFQPSGIVPLGFVPGQSPFASRANGISDDGVIVVGSSGRPDSAVAFVWDSVHGMRDLNVVAATLAGVDLTGWTFSRVNAVDAKGTTLVGDGVHAGVLAGFRLEVPCLVPPSILTNPSPNCGRVGRSVTLETRATRHGVVSYQWRRGGVAITDGNTPAGTSVSGSQSSTLSLVNLRVEDAGLYDCQVANPCGGVLTTTIRVGACTADFNCSGTVSVQDIFDFLGAYFTSDPHADVNGVGGVTVQDIFDFLASYFTGCP